MAAVMSVMDSLETDFGTMDPFALNKRVPLGELDSNQSSIFSPVGLSSQRRKPSLGIEPSSPKAPGMLRTSSGSANDPFASNGDTYSSNGKSNFSRPSSSSYYRNHRPDSSNDDSSASSSGRSSGSPSNGHQRGSPPYPLPSPGLSPFTFNMWGKIPETTYSRSSAPSGKENTAVSERVAYPSRFFVFTVHLFSGRLGHFWITFTPILRYWVGFHSS